LQDIDLPVGVDNRDYHYLSQFEIDGAKRISRHLSPTSLSRPICKS
jgi:hypothetical protein